MRGGKRERGGKGARGEKGRGTGRGMSGKRKEEKEGNI